MPMSSSHDSGCSTDSPGQPLADEPITTPEAALIEEDARERAGKSDQEMMGARGHARVEAEARRISEEMTRRAQDERRAAERLQAPPAQGAAHSVNSAALRLFPSPAPIARILVPLSGAEFAERAIPYAVALARLTGASLALIHVGYPPRSEPANALEHMLATLTGVGAPTTTPSEAEGVSPTIGQLWQQVAPQLAGIEWLTLPEGSVSRSLLALEAPDGSDLVVLATRRHPGAEGDTLGAVERALIWKGDAPTLVIPPSVEVPMDGQPTFRRVLVPLDGSALAEQALAPLLSMLNMLSGRPVGASDADARGAHHEIVLLSVAEVQQTLDDASRYLNDIAAALQSQLPATVQVSVEEHVGSPPGAIVALAAQGGEAKRERPSAFDLVALATHGRGGLRRWLLGSVAEYVLTHATTPVLVVRPTPSHSED